MVNPRIVAGVLGMLLAVPALATASPQARPGHSVNAREHRQVLRIRQGVRAHEITPAELGRLRADEAALRATERAYRESGKGLNAREYRDLQRELDRISREIARATHNDHPDND